VLAQEEARLLNHDFIGTEHILLGMLAEGDGVAARVLESLGVPLGAVREKVAETIGPSASSASGAPPFTPRAKKVLELSLQQALKLGHNYIGTEHMLLGLVRESEGVAAQVLVALGADLSRVRQRVIEVLSDTPSIDEQAAVDPEAVVPTEMPADPAILVDRGDVEAALCTDPMIQASAPKETNTPPVTYRTCTYVPRTLPTVSISVVGAEVTREAFDSFGAGRGWADVDGLGDAATYNPRTSSLRVLKGSTVFVVSVIGAGDHLVTATALARTALKRLDRLGEGPHSPAVN